MFEEEEEDDDERSTTIGTVDSVQLDWWLSSSFILCDRCWGSFVWEDDGLEGILFEIEWPEVWSTTVWLLSWVGINDGKFSVSVEVFFNKIFFDDVFIDNIVLFSDGIDISLLLSGCTICSIVIIEN